MPDMQDFVKSHGSIRKYQVELIIEHADGYMHKIAMPIVKKATGFSADDMNRELIKAAQAISLADIEAE